MHCSLVLWSAVKSEVESLQKVLQERSCEIRYLQKQVTDAEREKHSEVVKLRLEVSELSPCKKQPAMGGPNPHCSTMQSYSSYRKRLPKRNTATLPLPPMKYSEE